MLAARCVGRLFRFSVAITVLCLSGVLFVFLHSYYWGGYRTVKNLYDPRWRVFDFNSRQASESEIYNVADTPAIRRVWLVGHRRLRFEFAPPIDCSSWKVVASSSNQVNTEGAYPEIQFPDEPFNETYLFIPEGVDLVKPLAIEIQFYPKEKYEAAGLSWGDNYYTPASEIPFSLKAAHSVDQWAGIPDHDPEILEARRILGDAVDANASALEKSEQVFCFIMEAMKEAGGTPTDELQSASPLETYTLLAAGAAKGFCENKALVYYLFANAAGVRTRLVDRAGKFGPLKLTGHYFCESWIPEYAKWVYVDPQIGISHIKTPDGIPIHTLELKRLVDLNVLAGCTALSYAADTGALASSDAGSLSNRLSSGLTGDIVLAYKFGYGNNKTFSKWKDFVSHTTLLYAPFALPRLHLVKTACLYGLLASGMLTLISWCGVMASRRTRGAS